MTCVVILFVWASSLKMVITRVLNETIQDFSDLFIYSIESVGVLRPTKVIKIKCFLCVYCVRNIVRGGGLIPLKSLQIW